MPDRGGTLMVDTFDDASPLGPIAVLADFVFLEGYMRGFQTNRASYLKRAAEIAA